MAEQLKAEEIAAAARIAGVELTERERAGIAQTLAGFLAALRGLPAGQTVEPLPVFTPGEEEG
ncbi:MAG TPA: hypothetical protein VFW08_09060 [bacterium]|nr:hypothetical protein [bacterium]